MPPTAAVCAAAPCCPGVAPPNAGGELTPLKLGGEAAGAPPNVGAGAGNVEPPVAPDPKGLAFGAGLLAPLLKLKTPDPAGAGGLWTAEPKLNAPEK